MKLWLSLVVLTFWLAGCDRLPSSSSSAPTAGSGTSTVAVAPVTNTVAATSRPPAPAETDVDQYQHAHELQSEGKLSDARALLQPLADDGGASDKALDLLGEIDTTILLTPGRRTGKSTTRLWREIRSANSPSGSARPLT